jgi:hypothetical protein
MKYTVTIDYGATGEGRTVMALLTSAENPEHAKQKFAELFDEYFARGAEVQEGCNTEHPIVVMLFSDLVRTQLKEERCSQHASAHLHFNYS